MALGIVLHYSIRYFGVSIEQFKLGGLFGFLNDMSLTKWNEFMVIESQVMFTSKEVNEFTSVSIMYAVLLAYVNIVLSVGYDTHDVLWRYANEVSTQLHPLTAAVCVVWRTILLCVRVLGGLFVFGVSLVPLIYALDRSPPQYVLKNGVIPQKMYASVYELYMQTRYVMCVCELVCFVFSLLDECGDVILL